jgi:hypothetical protein
VAQYGPAEALVFHLGTVTNPEVYARLRESPDVPALRPMPALSPTRTPIAPVAERPPFHACIKERLAGVQVVECTRVEPDFNVVADTEHTADEKQRGAVARALPGPEVLIGLEIEQSPLQHVRGRDVEDRLLRPGVHRAAAGKDEGSDQPDGEPCVHQSLG